MKYIKFISLFLLFHSTVHAAPFHSDTLSGETSILEKLTATQRPAWLPKVNLNTRIAFHHPLEDNGTPSAFRLDYLRLQVQGNINERIFYKWLQHLNRSNAPRSLDNSPSSIDCLGVGFHITPTLSSFVGKQYADFGGFEYDANPEEVYQYSDMGEYITCFLVGANLCWQFKPTHELRFQIVNGRSGSLEDAFGKLPDNFRNARTPLGYTINWNGSFLDSRLYTRSSFTLFHEGKEENVYLGVISGAWIEKRFNMYVDMMYSAEDIDKLGILTEMNSTDDAPLAIQHCRYLSLVSRINYRILPKLNVFVKGAYETATVQKENTGLQKGRYKTTYHYQGGFEYFPMMENLRFFAMYRGRHNNYTDKVLSPAQYNKTGSLSFGLIYNIPVL